MPNSRLLPRRRPLFRRGYVLRSTRTRRGRRPRGLSILLVIAVVLIIIALANSR